MAQKLIKWSKLNNRTLNELVQLFVLEVPARKAARELGLNRHTAERVYDRVRQAMARACEDESILDGEVEVDESYFGGHRKYLRGRSVVGKVVVFGLLKRKGRVYTRPVPNVSKDILRAIIHQKVPLGSTIYSDSLKSYDGLITEGYRHYRINHDKSFAHGKRKHINGIENFWGFAKTKLRRYYGVDRSRFFLYLKEMEFRFNHRSENLLSVTRKILNRYQNLLD